jgi:hypothetical protein
MGEYRTFFCCLLLLFVTPLSVCASLSEAQLLVNAGLKNAVARQGAPAAAPATPCTSDSLDEAVACALGTYFLSPLLALRKYWGPAYQGLALPLQAPAAPPSPSPSPTVGAQPVYGLAPRDTLLRSSALAVRDLALLSSVNAVNSLTCGATAKLHAPPVGGATGKYASEAGVALGADFLIASYAQQGGPAAPISSQINSRVAFDFMAFLPPEPIPSAEARCFGVSAVQVPDAFCQAFWAPLGSTSAGMAGCYGTAPVKNAILDAALSAINPAASSARGGAAFASPPQPVPMIARAPRAQVGVSFPIFMPVSDVLSVAVLNQNGSARWGRGAVGDAPGPGPPDGGPSGGVTGGPAPLYGLRGLQAPMPMPMPPVPGGGGAGTPPAGGGGAITVSFTLTTAQLAAARQLESFQVFAPELPAWTVKVR